MKANILVEVLKEARRTLSRHSQYKYYPHFSFLCQDGKIISSGRNSGHEPPKHLGYHKRINDSKPKTHSEFAAYKRGRKRLIPNKKFSCINIRLNKKGETKISKPCSCCFNFLKIMGCAEFFYCDENENWIRIT